MRTEVEIRAALSILEARCSIGCKDEIQALKWVLGAPYSPPVAQPSASSSTVEHPVSNREEPVRLRPRAAQKKPGPNPSKKSAKKFHCDDCDRDFNSSAAYSYHRLHSQEHGPGSKEKEARPLVRKAPVPRAYSRLSSKGPFVCKVCGVRTPNPHWSRGIPYCAIHDPHPAAPPAGGARSTAPAAAEQSASPGSGATSSPAAGRMGSAGSPEAKP